MRLSYLLLTVSILAGITGCDKDDNPTEPEVPSVITIRSPVSSIIYTNGSTMAIEGDIADNNVLSSAKVEIRNKTSGAVLFQQSSPTGNVGFYFFLWNWTITGITGPTVVTVKIIAVDKLGNQVFKEVDAQLDI
jgi:hypothetical protein